MKQDTRRESLKVFPVRMKSEEVSNSLNYACYLLLLLRSGRNLLSNEGTCSWVLCLTLEDVSCYSHLVRGKHPKEVSVQ